MTDRCAPEQEPHAESAASEAQPRRRDPQLEGSELHYRHVFHTAAVGMAQVALDGTFLDVNDRLCQIVGYERTALMDLPFRAIAHPEDVSAMARQTQRLVVGEIGQYELQMRCVREDGGNVWVHHTRSVVRDAAGVPQSFVMVLEDITDRKRSEDRLRLLAQAGQALGASLDFTETFQQAASLLVPHLADWCVVDLLDEDRRGVQLVGIAHAEPEKAEWARQLREHYPVAMHAAEASDGVGSVIRTGRSALIPVVGRARLEAYARDAEHLRLLERVGLRSVIITPLVARGVTLGALMLVWSDTDRYYDETDLQFAEEFARRAALAVDNARLFRQTHELNATLEARVSERSRQVRRLASEITVAEARERSRIARLLHDDLQQQLHVMQFQLEELRESAGGGRLPAFDQVFAETRQALREASATARTLTSELSPIVLQSEDFAVALVWLGDRFRDQYELDVTIDAPSGLRLANEALRDLLFSLVRECLFNVVKHAGVPRADVTLRHVGGAVEVEIADDGCGFDPARIGHSADVATGLGLRSAAQRLRLFDGSLRIDARPDRRGTRITVSLPMSAFSGANET